MKYIFICIAALSIDIVIAVAITTFVSKRRSMTQIGRITFAALISLLILFGVGIGYLETYYHADEEAKTYLKSSENVRVERIDGGYLFDGAGDNTAVIFYPGAKVEAVSYAPLLLHFLLTFCQISSKKIVT